MSNVENFLDHTYHTYRVEALEKVTETVLNFEQRLSEDIFGKYFSVEEIKQRFVVPPDYLQFIRGASFLARDAGDGYPWFWVLGAEDTYKYTKSAYEEFTEDEEYHQLTKPPFMAIEIGGWSDKHVFFLSCDKAHHWGAVYDCHDSFMYDLGPYDISYESFLDLLQRGA
ncbi:hypothetical protein BKI52_26955 [marine bacterium AO1-C]|nr:hypothetical protein BKI52_26955 [marine bacterium AO1-C]